jgi:integrase
MIQTKAKPKSKVGVGAFFDSRSRRKVVLPDGSIVNLYSAGLHYRPKGTQRSRLTGPYVKNKTHFDKAKSRVLSEEDTIDTCRQDELKWLKYQMLTAETRLDMAVNLVPEHLLNHHIVGAIIDEAKKIHEFILSNPDMDFDAAAIVAKVLDMPVEILLAMVPSTHQLPAPGAQPAAENSVSKPANAEESMAVVKSDSGVIKSGSPSETIEEAEIIDETSDETSTEVATTETYAYPMAISQEAQQIIDYNTERNKRRKFTIDRDGNLKFTECEPTANFLDWFIKTRPTDLNPRTKQAYHTVVRCFVRFFEYWAPIEKELAKKNKVKYKPSMVYVAGKPWIPFMALQHKDIFMAMQNWMLAHGKMLNEKLEDGVPKDTPKKKVAVPMSPATVKTYFGYVAASFKKAVKVGLIPETMNPHGRDGGYILPTPAKVDRALTTEELSRLWNYKPATTGKDGRRVKYTEQLVLDLFFMSYFSNGMNICDLLRLRWHQVYFDERYFEFIRSKIKGRKNTFEKVRVDFTPELEPLFSQYCTRELHPENYVLDFLTSKRGPNGEFLPLLDGTESIEERDTIMDLELSEKDAMIHSMNRILKEIARKLGIKVKLTTYYARHTLVNELAEAGISIAGIMKRLGQTSFSSYQHYDNRRRYKTECDISRKLFDRIFQKAVAADAAS